MTFMKDYLYVSDRIKKELVTIEEAIDTCNKTLDALSGNSYYELKNIELSFSKYCLDTGMIRIDASLNEELTNLIKAQVELHKKEYELRKKGMKEIIGNLLDGGKS